MNNSDLLGVYTFQHAGGEFDVHLRSQERFFAPEFQARASWHTNLEGDTINIDWGKFGKYEMKLTDKETRAFSGSLVGKPESWRKMFRRRQFTVAEEKLMDSKWTLTHPKGSFEIEFRADGFNHFICEEFPAHSHWKYVHTSHPPSTLQPCACTQSVLWKRAPFPQEEVNLKSHRIASRHPQVVRERGLGYSHALRKLGQVWRVRARDRC
jgi:hypothetical protein